MKLIELAKEYLSTIGDGTEFTTKDVMNWYDEKYPTKKHDKNRGATITNIMCEHSLARRIGSIRIPNIGCGRLAVYAKNNLIADKYLYQLPAPKIKRPLRPLVFHSA